MKDEENPKYMFSLTHTALLLDIIEGRIDPVELAKQEIVDRGLGKGGGWVGFVEARKIWGEGEKP